MADNVLADLMGAAVQQTEKGAPVDPLRTSSAQVHVTVGGAADESPFLRPVGQSKPAAKPPAEAEEPPEVLYDEEELQFQIGSAAVHDTDDDEFEDLDAPLAAPSASTAAAALAAVPPVAAALSAEEERRQVQRAAEEARIKAEAQRARDAELAAAAEAEEARQRAARMQQERANALKSVVQSVTGDEATSYGEISEKTETEKADDRAAAIKGTDATIMEGDEESGFDETPATAAAAEPAKPAQSTASSAAREARLMEQFDAATAAADASRAASKRGGGGDGSQADPRLKKILYDEASAQLFDLDLTKELQDIVREDWRTSASLVRRLLPSARPKLKNAGLRAQRDRIFALAKVPMDGSVLHERMIYSIYQILTGDSTCPARFGPHWEVIGFQGHDPATDLRGVGILSLLQVLHFASKRSALLRDVYQLSRGENDFPLMTVSINITQLALQTLRSGALHTQCNRSRQGLYEVFHSFYEALFLYMYTAWKSKHLSISDFGHLKNEIAEAAQKRPTALLKKLEEYGKNKISNQQAGQFNGFS
ncbi:hypothetical protein AB1Y20_010203 [Prymnesium parvum]|uniref:ELMO domain-containing protein n=1 Tax=Prymnesium parvum TaxID=97485 RepID=A0AB34K879_PRYPA